MVWAIFYQISALTLAIVTKYCVTIFAVAFLIAGCRQHRILPKDNLVYIQIGDSITFGAKNNGGNTPGDFAVKALAIPTTFIKLGWAAESAKQFNQYRREQFLDSLQSIPPGHRIILGVAYGANDLPQMPAEEALANIMRIARWAHDTACINEILIIPIMNRKDRWGITRKMDGAEYHQFNETRLWLNIQLHREASRIDGVKVANEADSPVMYAENFPDDNVRCADKVHPFDLGAKELGEGTIAHGIASFKGIGLK